jgi:hypothetical protein
MLNQCSGISEVVSLKLLYFYGFVRYVSSFQDIDVKSFKNSKTNSERLWTHVLTFVKSTAASKGQLILKW